MMTDRKRAGSAGLKPALFPQEVVLKEGRDQLRRRRPRLCRKLLRFTISHPPKSEWPIRPLRD
jgi:hypothetical protein